MAHWGAFKDMFEEKEEQISRDMSAGDQEEQTTGRADSGFVGLDNQGATCYLNALLQAMYMTPELRHGLYSVDPLELGGEQYEAQEAEKKEREKARLLEDRARTRKQEAEGKPQPDAKCVKQLETMFSLQGARRATLMTGNQGFEAAMEWALTHSNDDDFNDPMPGYENTAGAITVQYEETASRATGSLTGSSRSDSGSSTNKKRKNKVKAKMIPLELQKLFARLQLLDARTVSTEDLTSRGFNWQNDQGRVQQDAHELNRLLIDRLEKDLKISKTNSGLMSALYEGELANQVECLSCGHISERREKFYDVLLQVSGQEDVVTSLLSYTRPERLTGDNQYHCDRCSTKRDALRSQTLRKLPPLLIFSLNRFEFDMQTLERVKVQQEFKYPLVLDMHAFVEGRAWDGNNDSDESQVVDLAGHPIDHGTLRSRQKWVPQAWKEAEVEFGGVVDSIQFETGRGYDHPTTGNGRKPSGDDDMTTHNGLIYDLLSVVVHRGNAYSGHYHALIRDSLQEGRWTSPSGFMPALEETDAGPSRLEHREADQPLWQAHDARQAKYPPSELHTEKFSEVSCSDGSKHPIVQRHTGEDTGTAGLKGILVDILRKAPEHKELQMPSMQLPTLMKACKERLHDDTLDQVFSGANGKLENFLEANSDTFLVQPLPGQASEVLLVEDKARDVPQAGTADQMRISSSTPEQSHGGQPGVFHAAGGKRGDVDEENGGDFQGKKGPSRVSRGAVDAIASERYGRWFSFDDRQVCPISILDLEGPFSGPETAYLLIYRSRSLDEGTSPDLLETTKTSTSATAMSRWTQARRDESVVELPRLAGNMHMTSVPPKFWTEKVNRENSLLKSAQSDREADIHALTVKVWLPQWLTPRMPHLIPRSKDLPLLEKLSSDFHIPLLLKMDDRQSIAALKREVLARLGMNKETLGVPDDPARSRLSELVAHGPGLFVTQHLLEFGPYVTENAKQGGTGGRGGKRGKGNDHLERPVLTLRDVQWRNRDEAVALLWDGHCIGSVQWPKPMADMYPIQLVVTMLKPNGDADPFRWLDVALRRAEGVSETPRFPTRGGDAPSEVVERWTDVFVRAGVTYSELRDLIVGRGAGGFNPAKLCISVLRSVATEDHNGIVEANEGRTPRDKLEALQIAGPEGVFQECQSRSTRQTTRKEGGGVGTSLQLEEGCEVIVEEEGAMSALLRGSSFMSLADMEAAKRNRLVRMDVEIDEVVLTALKDAGLAFSHRHAVRHHAEESIVVSLEADGLDTTITRLKALCLLDVAPDLSTLTAAELVSRETGASSSAAISSTAADGDNLLADDLALPGLAVSTRLASVDRTSGIGDAAAGATLASTKIKDGCTLRLEWRPAHADGKTSVKFCVITGNGKGKVHDPYHAGSKLGTLQVEADMKETVCALKKRMVAAATEAGLVTVEDVERRIRLTNWCAEPTSIVPELAALETPAKAGPKSSSRRKPNNSPNAEVILQHSHEGKKQGEPRHVKEEQKEKNYSAGRDSPGNVVASVQEETSGRKTNVAGKSKRKKRKKKPSASEAKTSDDREGSAEIMRGHQGRCHGVAGEAKDAGNGMGSRHRDLLVEESGISTADLIHLEEGRAPRPKELEINVLAYAPHYVGLSATAASEHQDEDHANRAMHAWPNGCSTVNKDQSSRRRKPTVSRVATQGVWPMDQAEEQKLDRERRSADATQALLAHRRMSLRTLGQLHIDERSSCTDLRSKLVCMLRDGLRQADQLNRDARAQALAAAINTESFVIPSFCTVPFASSDASASGGDVEGDESVRRGNDVTSEEEQEACPPTVSIGSSAGENNEPATDSRKMEAAQEHCTASDTQVSEAPVSQVDDRAGVTSPPDKQASVSGLDSKLDASGHCEGTPNGDTQAAPSQGPAGGGLEIPVEDTHSKGYHTGGISYDGENQMIPSTSPTLRATEERIAEFSSRFADSDDGIPTSHVDLMFDSLDEAVLVRELRRDGLPGKIVRMSDGAETAAEELLEDRPISDLRLSSSTALVLCIRPRLPFIDPTDSIKAEQEHIVEEGRSRMVEELVENGQVEACLGTELGDERKEPKARSLPWRELDAATKTLRALEDTLRVKIEERERREEVLKEAQRKYEEARLSAKTEREEMSMQQWDARLKTDRAETERIRNAEELVIAAEVKAMQGTIEEQKKILVKTLDSARGVSRKAQDPESPEPKEGSSTGPFVSIGGVLMSGAKATLELFRGIQAQDKSLKTDGGNQSNGDEQNHDSAPDGNDPDRDSHKKSSEDAGNDVDTAVGASHDTPVSVKDDDWGIVEIPKGKPSKSNKRGTPSTSTSSETTLSSTSMVTQQQTEFHVAMSKRLDPPTDLHLWTFRRRNPLADRGSLPVDEPAWPGPLKEVVVENALQPTLENLHEALGKAYGLPSCRIWAVKHSWTHRKWTKLTPEAGMKKVTKKSYRKKGSGGSSMSKKQVTNIREHPYGLIDGDVIAVIDRHEDPEGIADLTRAEDEEFRDRQKRASRGIAEKEPNRRRRPASKHPQAEVALTLGADDHDDGTGVEDEVNDGLKDGD